MKLSIIMPVYNVEDYLAQSIEGILMQSVPEDSYEIIIVNDSTPDGSMEIAERYRKNHPQIKIVNRENGGLSAARNTGIAHAKGDYIVLLDSDDFYSKDFFNDLYKIMDESQPDLILFDFNYYAMADDTHQRETRTLTTSDVNGHTGQEVLEKILNDNILFSWYPWAYAVKRSLVVDNAVYFVPGKHYEDIFWTPLLYLYAKKMAYLDKAVLEYRLQRPGQITGTVNLKNLSDPFDAPAYMKDRMASIQASPKLKHDILRSISNKYFKAPFYARRINREDRLKLIDIMEDKKDIIGYTTTPVTKGVNAMMVVLGVRNTVEIISLLYTVFRSIKKKK